MAKEVKASWEKHCHDYLGADVYETSFPSLYGTGISISTFAPKTILEQGEVLKESLRAHPLIIGVDSVNRQRMYVIPNTKADTKLSLSCCFEGDCVDWDANSAFFRDGELVAMVSLMDSKEQRIPEIPPVSADSIGELVKIYRNEIRRLARGLLDYEGRGDPFKEFIQILKAESPKGKGLHDSYRDSIRSILNGRGQEK